jgi:catechol 2,3-dioxygenase-like lactoylglutathione lyase family enzyme
MSALHVTGVGTVGVPVADQDRALASYAGVLGFETRLDAPYAPGLRWLEVAPPGAATTLALVAAGDDLPVGVETGIRLASRDAAADHEALRARGADVDELLRWDEVPPMFVLRDPDGNRLVVVERP